MKDVKEIYFYLMESVLIVARIHFLKILVLILAINVIYLALVVWGNWLISAFSALGSCIFMKINASIYVLKDFIKNLLMIIIIFAINVILRVLLVLELLFNNALSKFYIYMCFFFYIYILFFSFFNVVLIFYFFCVCFFIYIYIFVYAFFFFIIFFLKV